ncbi:MAG: TolC family protein [Bacteroidota bacterium]
MQRRLLFTFAWLSMSFWLCGQSTINITFVLDQFSDSTEFLVPRMQEEINVLLQDEYDLAYRQISMEEEGFPERLNTAYQNSEIIIGAGLEIGSYLSRLPNYPKPTILSIIIDNELQGVPLSDEGTSGTPNLTYVQSFFSLERDLATLYQIRPYEDLIVLIDGQSNDNSFNIQEFVRSRLPKPDINFQLVPIRSNEDPLSTIPTSSEVVFAFPLNRVLSLEQQRTMYQGLAQRSQITFSLLSNPAMQIGGYAAFDTDSNLDRLPRRVALNVLKITEGVAAEDIPVRMQSFTENLLISMKTAKQTGLYPSWDILADAILVDVNDMTSSGAGMSLRSAVVEGLEQNLELSAAQRDLRISDLDIKVARSNYLPQLDVTATGLRLDDNSVRNSFGLRSRFALSGTATFTQLILSEPALANIAIQRFLRESTAQVLRQNELDVIVDVCNGYLNILQAQALVELRNENLGLTRKNLDIAQAKEQVGFSGTSDVYRLESELALDNIDLNNALASSRQARFALNSILNRPINDEYELQNLETDADISFLVMDERIAASINNPGDANILGDFFVQEAMRNLPEIKQIEAAIAAQERSLKSQNRAFYLPQIVLNSEYNLPIANSGYPEGVMPIEQVSTLSTAVSAQMPIFQGNSRRFQQQQTRVDINRLGDQLGNLRNNLELQVRANLENVYASYSRVQLSEIALEAAQNSFAIAQDNYQQGLLNITSLLDAQNALLQTDINATTAVYTFISDYLNLERSIGYFHFVADPGQRDGFYSRYIQFTSNRQ